MNLKLPSEIFLCINQFLFGLWPLCFISLIYYAIYPMDISFSAIKYLVLAAKIVVFTYAIDRK